MYQYFPFCPYESKKTNISPKKNFKRGFPIWQLLGLERTLLSELPHMRNMQGRVSLSEVYIECAHLSEIRKVDVKIETQMLVACLECALD